MRAVLAPSGVLVGSKKPFPVESIVAGMVFFLSWLKATGELRGKNASKSRELPHRPAGYRRILWSPAGRLPAIKRTGLTFAKDMPTALATVGGAFAEPCPSHLQPALGRGPPKRL